MNEKDTRLETMPCELISWARCQQLCHRLAQLIRTAGFQPDIIVAVGRGGWMPARMLSDLLGNVNLTSFKIEHYQGASKQAQARVRYPLPTHIDGLKVLLVDDVTDSGDTFDVALQHLSLHGQAKVIRSAVLHHKIHSSYTPDFYAARVIKWRWISYPWARREDISVFIQALHPATRNGEDIRQRLLIQHGISVSRQEIEDALLLLE